MRQPDCYVLIHRDGGAGIVLPQSFERKVRAKSVFGFWRVWVKR